MGVARDRDRKPAEGKTEGCESRDPRSRAAPQAKALHQQPEHGKGQQRVAESDKAGEKLRMENGRHQLSAEVSRNSSDTCVPKKLAPPRLAGWVRPRCRATSATQAGRSPARSCPYIEMKQHEVCERHEGNADGEQGRRHNAGGFPSRGRPYAMRGKPTDEWRSGSCCRLRNCLLRPPDVNSARTTNGPFRSIGFLCSNLRKAT